MKEKQVMLVNFIRIIAPIPQHKAEEIVSVFTEKQFRKGDFILQQGKVCNEYYFLTSGFVRAWTIDLEGRDVTTAFYSAGNVVCELFSFFKRITSGENLQALEDSEVLFITFNELQSIFHSMPEFREFGRSILVNAYASLKQRVLSSLHQTAEQRYKELLATTPEIFQHASLKQIASYLGVTDTSLSRIRKEFAKEH